MRPDREKNRARDRREGLRGGGEGGIKLPYFDQLLFCLCGVGDGGAQGVVRAVCGPGRVGLPAAGLTWPADTQASHTPIPGTSTQSLTFPQLQQTDQADPVTGPVPLLFLLSPSIPQGRTWTPCTFALDHVTSTKHPAPGVA